MVHFHGRILALGRRNLQLSWCKCPGVPRGQPSGMAAAKCLKRTFCNKKISVVNVENDKLAIDVKVCLFSVCLSE